MKFYKFTLDPEEGSLFKCFIECVYEQHKNLERESIDVKILALDAGPGLGSKIS